MDQSARSLRFRTSTIRRRGRPFGTRFAADRRKNDCMAELFRGGVGDAELVFQPAQPGEDQWRVVWISNGEEANELMERVGSHGRPPTGSSLAHLDPAFERRHFAAAR